MTMLNKVSFNVEKNDLHMSMPFSKVDKEKRVVSGWATVDSIDKQDDIVTTEASINAFKNFRNNIREMHQPSAVGKMISFKEDKYFDSETKKFYTGIFVSAYISKGAQDAWEKVLDGTYTGFSIGGRMNKWDDAYNEELNKTIRVIKEYDLVELSLVDSPANQFANIVSVEKVDGINTITGPSADVVIENVFYDKENGIVLTSEEETKLSPISGEEMKNIGFVEKSDTEKVDMIKFLVDSAKGINTIKITKEVSPMIEDTITDAPVAEVTEVVSAEVTPEAQPVVEAAPVAEVTEKADEAADDSATSSPEDATQILEEAPAAVAEDATKADEVIATAVTDLKDSVTNAFGDLTATLKSLSDEVANLKKSLEATTTDVNQIKGTFNEIGKRVDLVELDTAFRKSGDLGEIVQEPVMVQKSLWGGRFLKFSDLYN